MQNITTVATRGDIGPPCCVIGGRHGHFEKLAGFYALTVVLMIKKLTPEQ